MDLAALEMKLVDCGLRWPALKQINDIKVEPEVKRQFSFATAATLVGIEIEIEGYAGEKDEEALDGVWYTKEDGSLRDGGIEFVSFAMEARYVPQALKILFTNLRDGYKFSERTGIHFHINFRTKKLMDVLNMGLIYLPFERLLYRLAGEERYNNIFCTPIQETQSPDVLAQFLQDGLIRPFTNNWDKYSGMNFLPLTSFGSVEFRHMQGTDNIPDLVDFLNVILAMRKYAADHTFDHIWTELQPLNNNSQYEWFLQKVMGDFARPFYRMPGLQLGREMEGGIAAAKLINPPSAFCKDLIEAVSLDSDLLKKLKVKEKKPPKPYTASYNVGGWPPQDGIRWNNDGVERQIMELAGLARGGGGGNPGDVDADEEEDLIARLAARARAADAPGGW